MMRYIATFDIGTTAVKAVLVGEDGHVAQSASREIPTLFHGERKEQDARVWWDAFVALSRGFFEEHPAREIGGIVMSGQMQDVIPVDGSLRPLGNAILYSDGRGQPQAERLVGLLGEETIAAITGNHFDGSLSLAKILWLKENEPERYEKARAFLISSKDYVIAKLTGICAGDGTACSTAGAMDLQARQWSKTILAAAGVDPAKMPALYASHQKVGGVTGAAAGETGYLEGTPVYAGVGDAGATTMASGIADVGQYNINLGTSGWVATISSGALQNGAGVFNLAAMPEGKVINVVPFLNAGNVHHWVTRLFSPERDSLDYEGMNRILRESRPGSHGLMALPYLVGERFPVLDAQVKGAYVGITPETGKEDMARAMLEGVGYSIRQGMESIGAPPSHVSVIGGGGRVKEWCQMIADILGQPLYVYQNADTLPARAIAAAALIGQGICKDYGSFVRSLQSEGSAEVYKPRREAGALYEPLFRRYVELYPMLKAWH